MTPLELTEAREALHLSQKALAEVLGVHPTVVNRWERGHAKIPPYMTYTMLGIRLQNDRRGSAPRVDILGTASLRDGGFQVDPFLELAPDFYARLQDQFDGQRVQVVITRGADAY